MVGVPEDVQVIVVRQYTEISFFGTIPLIDYFLYLIAPFTQIKAERVLIGFIRVPRPGRRPAAAQA